MKRYKMKKSKSRRVFKKTTGYHKKNVKPKMMRGTTRL